MSSDYLYMDVPFSQEILLAVRKEMKEEFLKDSMIAKLRTMILRKKDGVFSFHSLDTDNLVDLLKKDYPVETRRLVLWTMMGAEMTVRNHEKDKPRWKNTRTTLGLDSLKDEIIQEIRTKLAPLKVFVLLSYDSPKLLFTLRVNFGKNAETMIEANREKKQIKQKSRGFSEEDEAKLEIAGNIGDFLKDSLNSLIANCVKEGLVSETDTDAIVSKLMGTFADVLVE